MLGYLWANYIKRAVVDLFVGAYQKVMAGTAQEGGVHYSVAR